MPPPHTLAGSVRITPAEVPADVHGIVVSASGFTIASEGRAFIVSMSPEAAAAMGRHLLRFAEGQAGSFGRFPAHTRDP